MSISKKLLLILLLVSLFLVSCDLFKEEDQKSDSYNGLWSIHTLTYSVGDYKYVVDYNEYDKPFIIIDISPSTIHFYTLDSEKDIYEHTKEDYINNGSLFSVDGNIFYITTENSSLYMTFITNDDEDYDNDGDTSEDFETTYLYKPYSGTEMLNAVDATPSE